jgi:hypothetical protein
MVLAKPLININGKVLLTMDQAADENECNMENQAYQVKTKPHLLKTKRKLKCDANDSRT